MLDMGMKMTILSNTFWTISENFLQVLQICQNLLMILEAALKDLQKPVVMVRLHCTHQNNSKSISELGMATVSCYSGLCSSSMIQVECNGVNTDTCL